MVMDKEVVMDSLFEDGAEDDKDAGRLLDSLLDVVITTVEAEEADEETTDEDSTLLETDVIAEVDIADTDGAEEEAANELGLTAEALLEAEAAGEDQPP